jgi:hypothetical protein
MSVRVTREEVFFVQRRHRPDWSGDRPEWEYWSRHKTAQTAHRAREAAIRAIGCGARQVRVVRMTVVTTIEILANPKKEKAS